MYWLNLFECFCIVVENDEWLTYVPLKGYKRHVMFLATQVPLEETVGDFWKMVWENNSGAIVMLSLIDQGEDNCSKKKVCVHHGLGI